MLSALSGRTHRVLTAVAVAAGRRNLFALSVSRVHFARAQRRRRRGLRRQRRALWQGRRLCDPGACGGLDRTHRRQLHRYHGFATARDRTDAASGPGRLLNRASHARHPHQLDAAGNPCRRGRERRRAGVAHRARARARAGRQHLPGQGGARAAGHAERLCRHRPGARGLPACGRPACRLRASQWQWRQRRQRQRAAADRAPGVRGPGADRAGGQGPDRHQGRAPVDADQHRRAHAGPPAAGQPHRHLAEDRLARVARAVAPAHGRAGGQARGGRRRWLHPAHQRRRSQRHRTGDDIAYLRKTWAAVARARLRLAAGHPAAPGPDPGRARAARPEQRRHANDPCRFARSSSST